MIFLVILGLALFVAAVLPIIYGAIDETSDYLADKIMEWIKRRKK